MRLARLVKLDALLDDVSTTDGVMRSISRAAIRSDAPLANRLVEGSAVARRKVCAEGGRVSRRCRVRGEVRRGKNRGAGGVREWAQGQREKLLVCVGRGGDG